MLPVQSICTASCPVSSHQAGSVRFSKNGLNFQMQVGVNWKKLYAQGNYRLQSTPIRNKTVFKIRGFQEEIKVMGGG